MKQNFAQQLYDIRKQENVIVLLVSIGVASGTFNDSFKKGYFESIPVIVQKKKHCTFQK